MIAVIWPQRISSGESVDLRLHCELPALLLVHVAGTLPGDVR